MYFSSNTPTFDRMLFCVVRQIGSCVYMVVCVVQGIQVCRQEPFDSRLANGLTFECADTGPLDSRVVYDIC